MTARMASISCSQASAEMAWPPLGQSTFSPALAMRKWGVVSVPWLPTAANARMIWIMGMATDWPKAMYPAVVPSYSS